MKQLSSLLSLSISLFACASDDGRDRVDQGKSDTEHSPHAIAVLKCDSDYQTAEGRDDPKIGVELDASWQRCVAKANVEAAPAIDLLIPEGHPVSPAAAIVAQFEQAATSFCESLARRVAPADRAGEAVFCHAYRTRDLATLIGAYTAFGDFELAPYEHSPDQFPACHAAYSRAMEQDSSQLGMIEATSGLAACLEAGAVKLADDKLAPMFVRQGLTAAAAKALLSSMFEQLRTATDAACATLAASGGEAGGSNERLAAAGCRSDVASMLGSAIEISLD